MIYTWIRYKSTGYGHTSADTRIILRNQSLQLKFNYQEYQAIEGFVHQGKMYLTFWVTVGKMYSDECPAMTNVYLKSGWNWCTVWSL